VSSASAVMGDCFMLQGGQRGRFQMNAFHFTKEKMMLMMMMMMMMTT
jgi:hypothetical protein